MGRKTDVGVLSIYVTGDTKDFQKALSKTAGKAVAFKAVLQGSLNSIKGSFTELMSKLSFLAQGFRGVLDGANILGQGISLAFDPTANKAAKLEELLFRLPFGFGEVGRSFANLLATTGAFNSEVEKLSINEARVLDSLMNQMAIRKRLHAVQDSIFKLTADELDIIDMEADNAILPIIEDLRLLENQIDSMREADVLGRTGSAEAFGALHRQVKEYRLLIKTQEQLFQLRKDELIEKRREASIAQDLADKQKQDTKEINEQVRQEANRNKAIRERQKLEKAIATQQERVRQSESQNWTGATATISTAIGSMKVGVESQTLAIQKRIMEETTKEVNILQDMRTIMQNQGAGALT